MEYKEKKLAIKQLLLIGNDILRKNSEDIIFKNDPVQQYIDDLADTLHYLQNEKKIGRAIAGPQIGILKNIIYMESNNKKIIMINPKIIKKSGETFEVWDSCFSANVEFFGKTIRHKKITVEYFDENQKKIQLEYNDDFSELFQHEIDHLNGVLFTDHIINNQIIMRSEWEKLYND